MSGAHKSTWWGALDPYTFGVWISEDKIHDFPDPDRVDPLFITSLVVQPGAEHRAFVEALDGDSRVAATTAFTAYAHEWRHWFDSTSTPFGIVRTAQLAGFYATAVAMEDLLVDHPRIHVPLKQWARSPNIVALAEPEIGHLNPEIVAILEQALAILKKADYARLTTAQIHGMEISTSLILEALAMLEQERLLERVFGREAVDDLRTAARSTEAGRTYYRVIDLVEGETGLRADGIIGLLEGTLFANYGAYGSTGAIPPAELLALFLEAGDWATEVEVIPEVDRLLLDANGFDRTTAHEMCYSAAVKTLGQIEGAAEQDRDGSSAKTVRSTIARSLRDAFLWSGAARFRAVYGEEVDGELPEADPYALPAPLFVEGYPGRYGSEQPGINTLAGYEAPIEAMRVAFPTAALPKLSDEEGDPRVQSVVWTPQPTGAVPKYFEIFNGFRDLMYWRGLIFGPGEISPFTFWFTTLVDAEARGQTFVGPQVPSFE